MSDDIVSRLRTTAIAVRPLWRSEMMEASDEIECLRAIVKRWETCEMVTESLCGVDDRFGGYCDTCRDADAERIDRDGTMNDDKCPWNTHPKTIEQMIESCQAQGEWEAKNYKQAPILWCIVPTRQMFLGLCLRIVSLENKP